MARRSPSPAISEREYGITQTLFPDEESSDSDDGSADQQHPERKARMREEQEMPNLAGGDSASDDADFIADAQATSNRKASNNKGRTVKKGGGLQAMGLNANLLKAVTRKGFSVPTPIQRKAIPLVLEGKDVVGMARIGSGKTAAFVIPTIPAHK